MKTTSNQTPMKFKTTAIYLSGAICGQMWLPAAMAGKLIRKDLRGPWGFYSKGDSFRDALNSLLCRDGGDFQNPLFTSDTCIHIERKTPAANGRYETHSRTIELSALCGCADLIAPDFMAGDFCGDCE